MRTVLGVETADECSFLGRKARRGVCRDSATSLVNVMQAGAADVRQSGGTAGNYSSLRPNKYQIGQPLISVLFFFPPTRRKNQTYKKTQDGMSF